MTQRELLGRTVRDAWVNRQMLKHPGRVFPVWDQLTDFERETDMLIGEAVLTAWQSDQDWKE